MNTDDSQCDCPSEKCGLPNATLAMRFPAKETCPNTRLHPNSLYGRANGRANGRAYSTSLPEIFKWIGFPKCLTQGASLARFAYVSSATIPLYLYVHASYSDASSGFCIASRQHSRGGNKRFNCKLRWQSKSKQLKRSAKVESMNSLMALPIISND